MDPEWDISTRGYAPESKKHGLGLESTGLRNLNTWSYLDFSEGRGGRLPREFQMRTCLNRRLP